MPNIVVDTTDRSKSLYYNISKYIFTQFFTDEDLGINANLMLQKISAKAKLRRTKIVNFWTRYGEKFCLAFGRELDKKDDSLQVEITPAIFYEELLIKVDHETIQRLILGIGGELNTQVIYINNQRQECPFSMHVLELCDLLRQVHTTNEMMTDLYEIVFKVIQSYGNDMNNVFVKKTSDAERATVTSLRERANISAKESTKKKSTPSGTKRKLTTTTTTTVVDDDDDDDAAPVAKHVKRERETTDEDEEDEDDEEEAESLSDKSVEVVEDVIASSPTDDVVGQLIPGNLPEIKPLNIPRSTSTSTNANNAITATSATTNNNSSSSSATATTTIAPPTETEKKKTAEENEEEEEDEDDDVAL
nr:MAG: hypothetical protein [Apis mellifra filamentous-like virus]